MTTYTPPFKITPKILELCTNIAALVGKLEGMSIARPKVFLRKENQIKTIQGTVAIEGNTLTTEQITALLEGKPVLGPQKDITEVKNAVEAYAKIKEFNIHSLKDFLEAHRILMKNLIDDAGTFRKKGVGIIKNDAVAHVAPPAHLVPTLMANLFDFLENNDGYHLLIKASVFHYEVEFIHPFSDGNGRIGRLWEHAILTEWNPFFEAVPLENMVKENQETYYRNLEMSDQKGSCEDFITFNLGAIWKALNGFMEKMSFIPLTPDDRLAMAQEKMGNKTFARKDYLNLFKTISTATAGRDLQLGVMKGILTRTGDKRNALYHFV